MESNGKNSPLILAFYIDREMITSEIMQPFADQVDRLLVAKDANAVAFFLPTDGEERIECINPILVEETEMSRINKIIGDIKNNFDIGNGADKGKDAPDNIIDIKNKVKNK